MRLNDLVLGRRQSSWLPQNRIINAYLADVVQRTRAIEPMEKGLVDQSLIRPVNGQLFRQQLCVPAHAKEMVARFRVPQLDERGERAADSVARLLHVAPYLVDAST